MEKPLANDSEPPYKMAGTLMLHDIKEAKYIANETSRKIMEILSQGPSYSEDIARKLRIDRQRIYYRMKKLESAGLIRLIDIRNVNGSLAKIYVPVSGTVGFRFSAQSEEGRSHLRDYSIEETIFSEFISEKRFDGLVCVGSPDPHGSFRAISGDASYAVYLGMHIGTLANLPDYFPVILDSDLFARNMMRENLVLIGGPVTNTVSEKINELLPVKFRKEAGWALYDGREIYSGQTVGLIEKIKNPYNPLKSIVILAGNSRQGTMSAILGATKFWKFIYRGESEDDLHFVVRGYDDDSDGVIDSVERIF